MALDELFEADWPICNPHAWAGMTDTKQAERAQIKRDQENRAWAIQQPGRECYPWAPLHMAEAFSEATMQMLRELQAACESGDANEAGRLFMELTRDYWERVAKGMTE